MMDLISRQAAIDAINKEMDGRGNLDPTGWGMMVARDCIIEKLPSAQPERKKGHWMWIDGVRCSVCNYKLQTTGVPFYCPHCGARMVNDGN